MKVTNQQKEQIRKLLPISNYGDFLFKCPVCHKQHTKRIEFFVNYHKDGFSLGSYRQSLTTPICYECIVSEDMGVKIAVDTFIKEIRGY